MQERPCVATGLQSSLRSPIAAQGCSYKDMASLSD